MRIKGVNLPTVVSTGSHMVLCNVSCSYFLFILFFKFILFYYYYYYLLRQHLRLTQHLKITNQVFSSYVIVGVNTCHK
jgi:hypothetical protein